MSYRIVLDSNFSEYSTDLEYDFNIVKEFDDGRQRNFTTITIQDPEDARHFGFEPGEVNPTIRWLIYDNGEDKSNGSLAASNITDSRFSDDTVVTVQEQIIWITEYIQDNTSDPRWLLFGGRFSDRNGDGTDEGTNAVVESASITRTSDRPNAVRGTMNLKLGVTI